MAEGRLPKWIAHTVVQHRVAVIAVALAVAALFAAQIPNIEANFSPQSLFATEDEQQRNSDAFREAFGSTESVLLVLLESDDILSTERLQYLHDIAIEFGDAPWLRRVESITVSGFPRADGDGVIDVNPPVRGDEVEDSEAENLREALATSQFVEGVLISESHRLAVVAFFLENEYTEIAELRPVVRSVQAWLAAHPPPAGDRVEIGGIPFIRTWVVDQLRRDQTTLVPLSLLLSALFLFVCFRWLPGTLVPTTAVLISVVVSVGLMVLVGETVNIINQMLPILILIIGVSDSIHLVNRYGEELRDTDDRRLAAKRTVSTIAAACFLTSFTTAVGFASLIVARTTVLQRFGVATAAAMLIAYVVTITVVPAALSLFRAPEHRAFVQHDGVLERATVATVNIVLRHPWPVITIAVLTLVGAVFVSTKIVVDATLLEIMKPGDPTTETMHLIEEELNGIIPVEVSLISDTEGRFDDPAILNAVDELARWADEQPGVLHTSTYGDYLHEALVAYTGDPERRAQPFRSRAQVAQLYSLIEGARPDPTAAWVSFDRRRLRLNVQLADIGGRTSLALCNELLKRADELFAEFDDITYHLSGDGYSGARGVDLIMRDMLSSLGLAFVVIFIIMTLLFRSVRMGILSVPPNVIPLILTLAYMAARGIYLNSTSAIIFSVSLGLAVDDTIHVLARFREELAAGRSTDDAIRRTARGTGRAILVTSIMFVGGMVLLLWSSFQPIRLFAELVCVTLVGCYIGDLIVLPALLKVGWKGST